MNNPWSNITSYNSNTGCPKLPPTTPIYTPPSIPSNIPPPVTNPAGFVGNVPYSSANPIADFICAPSHTTPWPHNAGLQYKK